MSTLLAVYDGAGQLVGRCDAKCHDAEQPPCHCICGGGNHGVGRAEAVENTRARARTWLTTLAAARGVDVSDLDALIGVEVVQEALFDAERDEDKEEVLSI